MTFPGAVTQELHKAQRLAARERMQAVELIGGLGRNRTTDTRIFNPLLYQLSYQAERAIIAARPRRLGPRGEVALSRACCATGRRRAA